MTVAVDHNHQFFGAEDGNMEFPENIMTASFIHSFIHSFYLVTYLFIYGHSIKFNSMCTVKPKEQNSNVKHRCGHGWTWSLGSEEYRYEL